MRLHVLLCCALALAACASDDASNPDQDREPGPTGACYQGSSIAAADFIDCMFAAIEAACAASADTLPAEYDQGRTYLADAIADGAVVYAAGKAPACLRAVVGAGCGLQDARVFMAQNAACREALVGTVANGGSCVYAWECGSHRCTSNDGAACGTCYAPGAAEGACTPHPSHVFQQTCDEALYCDPTSSRCKPLITGEGTACAAPPNASGASRSCAGTLICAPDAPGSTVWECQSPVASGVACPTVSRMTCAAGLACDPQTDTCEQVLTVSVGDACDARRRCPTTARCLFPFDDPTATAPECVAIQTVATNATCDGVVKVCGAADTCDLGGGASSTCLPRLARDAVCDEAICAGELRCLATTDRCGDALAVGTACVEDLDCVSGFCNGTCATARDICG